jgi:hypothetical protein
MGASWSGLNKKIAEMPGGILHAGVRIVAIWHETVHVDQHLDPTQIHADE